MWTSTQLRKAEPATDCSFDSNRCTSMLIGGLSIWKMLVSIASMYWCVFLFQKSIIHRDQTPMTTKGHRRPPKATKGHQRPLKATKGYLVIPENTLIWYWRVKGEWLCSVLWSLIHAIWKRLFSIYYWGVADQIWQDCKCELLRELWELQTFPKYWKLCGYQLYQKLLTLLNYWRIQYYIQAFTRNSCISVHSTYLPIIYLRLIVAILKIEISSLMNWIFFPILNWNFLPTVVCKTQVWNKPKEKFIKFEFSN